MKRTALALWIVLSALLAFAQNQPVALNAGVKVPFSFDAYGDIRFMNPADHKDSDPVRRKLIVDKIAQDKPSFLLISGDLVANGGNPDQWKVFDQETAPIRNAGIKIYPALGNHDLRGDLPLALQNYFQRFPYLQNSRYYSVRAANVLILTLDSSLDQPGGEEMQWFDKQLTSIPPDVNFVIVQLHHPPITRSSSKMPGGGHSPRTREQDMAGFIEARQAKSRARFIVVAGHVHNYERYEHGGVMYITTGGGGATPYMIPRQQNDFYKDEGPTYHFCHFDVGRNTLSMRMMKLELQGDKAQWQQRDSFQITVK